MNIIAAIVLAAWLVVIAQASVAGSASSFVTIVALVASLVLALAILAR